MEALLEQLRDELTGCTKPLPARKQEIPKDGGKVRVLSIPAIRDRVVQVRSSSSSNLCSRRTSNRVVWISAQADSTRRDQASG